MNSNQIQSFIQAASTGKLDTLKQLLANENNLTEKNVQTLLAAAAWKFQTSIVDFLLSKFPSISKTKLSEQPSTHHPQTSFRFFFPTTQHASIANSTNGPLECLESLLIAGADPAQNPDCALPPLISVAGFYSDTRVADLLLMNGARVEDLDQAIEAALKCRNEPMVQFLIERAWEYHARK
ncbi:hypothetical protein BHYA_0042g00370 [Botrytis hyacinthi]|uniref:Uncharacterized protein n=1 Tax=Botrytis hyacinthi TaxID=278943 RepID=A0A4Z1GTA8_9HELO|nr:hypothetical protein BHYA_0042g00370 [Botrytis hyacinthi]